MSSTEQPAGADDRSERLAREHTDYRADRLVAEWPDAPLALFDRWLDEAFARRSEHGDLPDPSAVVLSTVTSGPDGLPRPRSRTVLLKGRDDGGFVMYTNLDSAKGRELSANPRASLLLPWYPLQRQVRIEGRAELLPDADSDEYFARRPRGSQIAAWASRQSWPIGSRQELEDQYAATQERFAGHEVPRPPHWGGIRVVPDQLEFWQGRANRLHDRIAYELGADGTWQGHRLQP